MAFHPSRDERSDRLKNVQNHQDRDFYLANLTTRSLLFRRSVEGFKLRTNWLPFSFVAFGEVGFFRSSTSRRRRRPLTELIIVFITLCSIFVATRNSKFVKEQTESRRSTSMQEWVKFFLAIIVWDAISGSRVMKGFPSLGIAPG